MCIRDRPEQTEKTVVEGENQDFENKEPEQKEESVTGEFENTENKVTDSEDKGKSEIKDQPKEQEFELTANETRDKLRKALRALYYNVTRTDAWVNDYDSKYVYYAKEVYSEEKMCIRDRIQTIEMERPISEVQDRYRDVDNLKKMIDVFYLGHLGKATGIRNIYIPEYEETMKKYSVIKNESGEDCLLYTSRCV